MGGKLAQLGQTLEEHPGAFKEMKQVYGMFCLLNFTLTNGKKLHLIC